MVTSSAGLPALVAGRSGPAYAALVQTHWYDALAVLLEGVPGAEEAARLAGAARRVLDLDAEDFAAVASGFPRPWAERLAASSFPTEPREPARGALASLVPLYELLLEAVQVRAARREPVQIVVTAHLIAEYLLQLAWESTLGHAGDPLRLAPLVAGTRWGTDDPACPHSSSLQSTARRAVNACAGDQATFTAYLDRFHSRQGDALGVCALNHATIGPGERPDIGESCPNPCRFVTDLSLARRRDLDARVRLALLYIDSPVVALRHHSPVGHFFGVPSVSEISTAWLRTWERLTTAWPDGANPLLVAPALTAVPLAAEPEAMPGMAALVSAVAGRPIGPGSVLRSIGADIAAALETSPA
jgi:hypothetical protein